MPCYKPLNAFRTQGGAVVFNYESSHVESLSLPCGQCVGCRLDRSRQWAVRCMHEASLHDENSFITLTYNDENLPENLSLNYVDFQLFMKRLRKHFSHKKVRFYMAGEYGENFGRPHFHACIFGLDFNDKVPLRKSPSGSMLYRSATLEKLWTYGFSSVGLVTFESAAYVARYIMKKMSGDPSDDHYSLVDLETGEIKMREPEFNRMSLKPGIGADWFHHFKDDLYPLDSVIVKGKKQKVPRYYDKLLERVDSSALQAIVEKRKEAAKAYFDDNTPQRLAVKELVKKAQVKKLKRSLT